ncbi:MAG: prephenate dehydratase [Candidatus Makaraimicrobium thalassicum]|nr:MAG: prephenate dehydratase [Candidatus Omnitrophota bacterium]
MSPKKLNDLRKEIDGIDSRIVELINRRGMVSCDIGEIKKKKKQPIYSPDRESQIYARVMKKNKGPLVDESVKAVYREIMSACLSLEQPMTVAYLGPELTFTHQASLKKFGSSVSYLSCDSIPDVFREVEKGNANYGVVPIENSTEGAVNHTLDMFVDSPLLICSELYYPVRHSLLCKKGSMRSITRVYSNPQVFGQCRGWIEKNLPWAKLRDAASTIKAAEIAARHADSACIASELAAEKYQLKVLARSIEDNVTNVTRFLVMGKQMSRISGADKTSVVFSVKDKPGILHDMLVSFKSIGINLTKIESRPSKKKLWKYYFFIDMEGHCETPKIKKALRHLEKKCYFLKTLGSYPKGNG